jgi:hypothetical protein
MEGLSIDVASGKLHGFLQSPLNDGKADYTTAAVPDATGKSENVRDYARFVRWVEFDYRENPPVCIARGRQLVQPGQDRQRQAG